jgi:hypothetical protein
MRATISDSVWSSLNLRFRVFIQTFDSQKQAEALLSRPDPSL